MRRYLPSLAALHAFEAAARFMNFTRAAEDVGLTQSGISRQIKNLEDFLGVTLFHRAGPRLILTEVGAVYFRDLSLVLDKLQEISIDAVRGRSVDSSLMIGAHNAFTTRWLIERLNPFILTHPDIPIEIMPAEPGMDFETTRLDMAILRGGGSWHHARAVELFAEELVIIASPALIPLGQRLKPRDFSNYPLLQNASRPSLWLHWLRTVDLAHSGRIHGTRFAHNDMLIKAAVHGLGIAVVPACFVEGELARGELHAPFGEPVRSGDSYFAVYPERKAGLPSIILFRDWLLRQTREYKRIAP